MGHVRGKWAAKRQADQALRIDGLEREVSRLAATLQSLISKLVEARLIRN
jgi:hypothetical protein